MKSTKVHAATINRRRAIEMARSHGEEIGMQGLYSYEQTELYVADPVIDVREHIPNSQNEVRLIMTGYSS